MTPPEEQSADNCELWSLAEAVCNGTIGAEQYARLNALLLADEDAARRYATYFRMHGLLLWRWQDAEAAVPSASTLPVIFEAPSLSVAHAPLLTGLSSPGGYLFSYSLAALIIAIGLLIGWQRQMSIARFDGLESVQVGPRPTPTDVPAESKVVFVGRVTGTVGCRWANPKTGTVVDADVPLGRKYALVAGLMEISYHSGAHVILQGPCTYNVESQSGGYLSLGRLTARVEKRGERGEGREERGRRSGQIERIAANQQSTIISHQSPSSFRLPPSPLSSLPSPLFSVRTPTAKITDLGTEFGVEVDESGVSKTRVYQGKVEMRILGAGDSKTILLTANESARVETGKDGVVALVRQANEKDTLVPRIAQVGSDPAVQHRRGLERGSGGPALAACRPQRRPRFQAAGGRGQGMARWYFHAG